MQPKNSPNSYEESSGEIHSPNQVISPLPEGELELEVVCTIRQDQVVVVQIVRA